MKFEVGRWTSKLTYDLLVKIKDSIVFLINGLFLKPFKVQDPRQTILYKTYYIQDQSGDNSWGINEFSFVAILQIPLMWSYGRHIMVKFLYKYTGFIQDINSKSPLYRNGLIVS